MSVKIKKEEFYSDEDIDIPRRAVAPVSQSHKRSQEDSGNHRSQHRLDEGNRFSKEGNKRDDRRQEDHRRARSSREMSRERDRDRKRGGGAEDRNGAARSRSNHDRQDHQRQPRHHERGRNRPRGGGGRGGGSQQKEVWGRPDQQVEEETTSVKKEEPSLALTGKLTEETNTFRGVVIKYNEPDDARKPTTRWRLYPFKGDQALPVLYVHRQSGYLIGRDHKICDIPMDHPSISKQHAVLQFRQIEITLPNNKKAVEIRPYLIDLESANGTYLNNQRLEATRYVELREKDMLKFGFSSREYVLLTEGTSQGADGGGSEDSD